jgi:hypothetical protein
MPAAILGATNTPVECDFTRRVGRECDFDVAIVCSVNVGPRLRRNRKETCTVVKAKESPESRVLVYSRLLQARGV